MTIAVAGVLMTCVGTSDIQAESYTVCSSGCDYTTIQGAISAASDGDTIQIQAGTYCENNLRIEGKSLTIEGVGTVDGCPAVTIDGEAEHRVFLIQGSSATDTCLDNLYICNGHTITDSKGSEWNGGGIWVGDCSPTISNCTIVECVAYAHGGGIYAVNSSATFTSCVIECCMSETDVGGGVYIDSCDLTFTDCTFDSNISGEMSSDDEGAYWSPLNGGGVYMYGSKNSSSGTFTDCVFHENLAFNGAAFYMTSASPTLTNCSFSGSSCWNQDEWLTGTSTPENGMVYLTSTWPNGGSSPVFTDCSFSYGACNYAVYVVSGSPTHSGCTFGDNWGGLNVHGDSDWDPFKGTTDPAIITLEDCTVCGTGDHVRGIIVHRGENHIHDCGDSNVPGDINGDGCVNGEDLSMLLGAWTTCP
jgi:hypothetical protein